MTLLEGGPVEPDSGDRSRYEGVADDDFFDERFWHPETEKDDIPRTHYGFPKVPGLLDAMRAPFTAAGLDVEWLAVHGNHDKLVQGTIAIDRLVSGAAVGGEQADRPGRRTSPVPRSRRCSKSLAYCAARRHCCSWPRVRCAR